MRESSERLRLERDQLEDEWRNLHETEQELEVSRQRFADLYDFAPVGYLTITRQGCILTTNHTATQMLCVSRAGLLGIPLVSLVAASDSRAFIQHLFSVNKRPSHPTTGQFCFRRKGEEPLLLQLVSQRDPDTSPNSSFIRTAMIDISQQRAGEEAQRRLAAIVEYSEDAIVGKNLEGVITDWNRGAERLFGYAAEEIIGKPVTLLIPSERLAEETEILAKLRRGEAVEHYETIRRRKDGSQVPVSLTISPIVNTAGQVIGASKIARDITRQKKAEQSLREAHEQLEQRVRERTVELSNANAALKTEALAHRRSERALRRSEARLQAILDNSPEMIFLKDTKGRYLLYNRRFAEAFHLSPTGALAKTDFQVFPRAQALTSRASDLKVVESGNALQFEEVMTCNGDSHVSIISKFPVRGPDRKIFAICGIVTDMTERRRLEGEVLRISEHERQRIARDLHDGLGQQIAGTWFLSEILRKNLAAQSSPEVHAADKVVRLLKTAAEQIRSVAHGMSPVSLQPNGLMVALEHLARQASDLFTIRCGFTCRQPVLMSKNNKATHLYRIAQEAVNNAVKHGRARSIQIELSATSGHVRLCVRDDGTGFKTPSIQHNGMGLRTMSYRADLIGATFAIQQRRNRGTEIVCELRNSS